MGSPPSGTTGSSAASGLLLLLLLLALLLGGPGPRLMAAQTRFRRAPGPALLVWQSVTTAAVLAAVLTGPVGLRLLLVDGATPARAAVAVAALVVGAGTLALLLLSGHRVGTRLRAARRRHRELVDVLALPDRAAGRPVDDLRVLDHATPTAYCVPGLRRRVVLTRGTMERLSPDELEAVLAHERAHLDSRHDLVLEYFTVVHEAVPTRVRSEAALREVRLLVEALADRVAARRAGSLPLARALVTLAGAAHPEATLGAGPASAARVRLELLDRSAPPARVAVMLGFAVGVLAVPLTLAVLAWSAAGSA